MSDPTPGEEVDRALDGLASGGLAVVLSATGALLAWLIDAWAFDLVLVLGSMAAAAWAVVAGWRGRRWLVVAHGVTLFLLGLIVLVSAPL
ncbi:MAG: hypothetical protein H6737_18515 [Alphaproteobacteria bacterium]|nr:hypothetical protein [Alphaproteobacteria bacterium]